MNEYLEVTIPYTLEGNLMQRNEVLEENSNILTARIGILTTESGKYLPILVMNTLDTS